MGGRRRRAIPGRHRQPGGHMGRGANGSPAGSPTVLDVVLDQWTDAGLRARGPDPDRRVRQHHPAVGPEGRGARGGADDQHPLATAPAPPVESAPAPGTRSARRYARTVLTTTVVLLGAAAVPAVAVLVPRIAGSRCWGSPLLRRRADRSTPSPSDGQGWQRRPRRSAGPGRGSTRSAPAPSPRTAIGRTGARRSAVRHLPSQSVLPPGVLRSSRPLGQHDPCLPRVGLSNPT